MFAELSMFAWTHIAKRSNHSLVQDVEGPGPFKKHKRKNVSGDY